MAVLDGRETMGEKNGIIIFSLSRWWKVVLAEVPNTNLECKFSFHLLSTASMARCFFHSARVFPDFPFSVNAWLVVRVVGLL